MYREFYSLSGKPFALTPDLKFLFRSDGHKRALSYLHYGLEQAEGFVVITGDIGTGKTLLIQALLEDLKTQEIATARVAAANLTKDEIIPMVAAALKQPYEGKSKTGLIRDLELSLRRARDYLKGVLLIVDEAQTLTPDALEELRILSNLESNGKALMQIFLVGQSDFRETLMLTEMEPLRQRTVASYHMQHLTRAEVKRYIGFRMLAVGWEGNPKIDNEVYDVIRESTDGIPRKINIFMDRFLIYGFLEELTQFTEKDALQVAQELGGEIAGDFLNRVQRARKEAKASNTYDDDDDEVEEPAEQEVAEDVVPAEKAKKPRKDRRKQRATDIDDAEAPSQEIDLEAGNNGELSYHSLDASGSLDPSDSPIQKRLHGLERKLKKLSEKTKTNRS